jgi:hypothetical protein
MSKGKYYFDVNEIKSIELTFEKVSNYKWREEIPSKTNYLLGFIPIGRTPHRDACWIDGDNDYWGTSDEKIKTWEWYRVQEFPKMVFQKPTVYLNLGYRNSYTHRFETNEEAQEWVDELTMVLPDKHFEVIER